MMQVQKMSLLFISTAAFCLLWVDVDAFVPSMVPSRKPSNHFQSTALFGVRSELRQRLSLNRLARRFFPKEASSPIANEAMDTELPVLVHTNASERVEEPFAHGYYPNTLAVVQTASCSEESQTITATTLQRAQSDKHAFRKHLDVMSATNSVTLTRAKTAASTSHVSLYSLPKTNRDLTRLEEEFRDMLGYFANYSEADLLSIADPRKRALFEGLAASSHSQPVYRAFEVLFEDLLPLRLTGRLVFTKLKQFMADSVEQRKTEIQRVVDQTGLTADTRQLEEIRLMFVSTASQLNGDSYLTLNQLAETGIITATATEVLGFESSEQLLHKLDTTQSGRLTFVDLMSGLWECANELCGLDNCNPQVVLHNLLIELNEHPPAPADINARLDANRRKFNTRYDEMVSSFIRWKHLLPPPPTDGSTESRRMEVVRGCFAGAELPKVVDALRIVYVDYVGLRVAGDIIFSLASRLLNRR